MIFRIPFVLLMLVGACAANAPITNNADAAAVFTLGEFLLDPFEQPIGHSLVLSDVKEKTLQRFGKPKTVDTIIKPDRYSDKEIKISTLHYTGLVIQIAERPEQGESWLTRVEISGKNYRLKNDIQIGTTRAELLEKLQPSNVTTSSSHLTIYEDIWEERTGKQPNDIVRVDASIQLDIKFDAADRAIKIVWLHREH